VRLQKHRERVAPLVLGALQRACEAAPPGGTASLPGPHVGGVPVRTHIMIWFHFIVCIA
jgi:hypothetical protein